MMIDHSQTSTQNIFSVPSQLVEPCTCAVELPDKCEVNAAEKYSFDQIINFIETTIMTAVTKKEDAAPLSDVDIKLAKCSLRHLHRFSRVDPHYQFWPCVYGDCLRLCGLSEQACLLDIKAKGEAAVHDIPKFNRIDAIWMLGLASLRFRHSDYRMRSQAEYLMTQTKILILEWLHLPGEKMMSSPQFKKESAARVTQSEEPFRNGIDMTAATASSARDQSADKPANDTAEQPPKKSCVKIISGSQAAHPEAFKKPFQGFSKLAADVDEAKEEVEKAEPAPVAEDKREGKVGIVLKNSSRTTASATSSENGESEVIPKTEKRKAASDEENMPSSSKTWAEENGPKAKKVKTIGSTASAPFGSASSSSSNQDSTKSGTTATNSNTQAATVNAHTQPNEGNSARTKRNKERAVQLEGDEYGKDPEEPCAQCTSQQRRCRVAKTKSGRRGVTCSQCILHHMKCSFHGSKDDNVKSTVKAVAAPKKKANIRAKKI